MHSYKNSRLATSEVTAKQIYLKANEEKQKKDYKKAERLFCQALELFDKAITYYTNQRRFGAIEIAQQNKINTLMTLTIMYINNLDKNKGLSTYMAFYLTNYFVHKLLVCDTHSALVKPHQFLFQQLNTIIDPLLSVNSDFFYLYHTIRCLETISTKSLHLEKTLCVKKQKDLKFKFLQKYSDCNKKCVCKKQSELKGKLLQKYLGLVVQKSLPIDSLLALIKLDHSNKAEGAPDIPDEVNTLNTLIQQNPYLQDINNRLYTDLPGVSFADKLKGDLLIMTLNAGDSDSVYVKKINLFKILTVLFINLKDGKTPYQRQNNLDKMKQCQAYFDFLAVCHLKPEFKKAETSEQTLLGKILDKINPLYDKHLNKISKKRSRDRLNNTDTADSVTLKEPPCKKMRMTTSPVFR